MKKVTCNLCFHHCQLSEGAIGFCHTRTVENGQIKSLIYGKVTALALDAIEKKPFQRFYPGSKILSVGSYGCSMRCPFCQNYEISMETAPYYRVFTPQELLAYAQDLIPMGNIGLAFTYNEPILSYEFMLDCFKLAKEAGLKTVMVTNGMIEQGYLECLLPYVDAMNVDIKCFTKEGYQRLQGNLEQVKHTVEYSFQKVHVELTSLIVPGLNDDLLQMREECSWIASLDPSIPLHITRYFPAYQQRNASTDVQLISDMVNLSKEYLHFVYKGNC